MKLTIARLLDPSRVYLVGGDELEDFATLAAKAGFNAGVEHAEKGDDVHVMIPARARIAALSAFPRSVLPQVEEFIANLVQWEKQALSAVLMSRGESNG